MPRIAGFSHVSLSVRDREASKAWYQDVFGFQQIDEVEEEAYEEFVLLHPTGAILCLQQHRANTGEEFDPARTGGDHIAFRVDDRAELDAWQERLAEAGVRHTPVVDREYGSVLCLRDPDGIQLELFYRADHP